jgi:hypothetical protein
MQVVPAGVKDAGHQGSVFATHGLVAGHGVHVGAIGHDGTRQRAAQDAHDTVATDAAAHLQAEASQLLGDQPGGPDLRARELRVLVDVATQRHQVLAQRLGVLTDAGERRVAFMSAVGTGAEQEGDGCEMFHV